VLVVTGSAVVEMPEKESKDVVVALEEHVDVSVLTVMIESVES